MLQMSNWSYITAGICSIYYFVSGLTRFTGKSHNDTAVKNRSSALTSVSLYQNFKTSAGAAVCSNTEESAGFLKGLGLALGYM